MINITTNYINCINVCTPHWTHPLVMLQYYYLHQQQDKIILISIKELITLTVRTPCNKICIFIELWKVTRG